MEWIMNKEISDRTFSWHIFVGAIISDAYFQLHHTYNYFDPRSPGGTAPECPPEIFTKDEVFEICNVKNSERYIKIRNFSPYKIENEWVSPLVSELDDQDGSYFDSDDFLNEDKELLEKTFAEYDNSVRETFPVNQESVSEVLVCSFPQVRQVIQIHTNTETINKIIESIRDNIYFILKKSDMNSKSLIEELYFSNEKIVEFIQSPMEAPCFSSEPFKFNQNILEFYKTPHGILKNPDDEIPF